MSESDIARALGHVEGIVSQSERNNDERHKAVLQRIDENRTSLAEAITGSTDGWKRAVDELRADHDKRLIALEERPAKTRKQFAAVVTGCMALATGIVTLLSKFGFHA